MLFCGFWVLINQRQCCKLSFGDGAWWFEAWERWRMIWAQCRPMQQQRLPPAAAVAIEAFWLFAVAGLKHGRLQACALVSAAEVQ
jgi:hypothetical protein